MVGGIGEGRRRTTNNLTDKAIKSFLAQERKAAGPSWRKLGDGQGLYLTTTGAGNPVWRLKYRYGGTERTYSIGGYPDTSLAEAREVRATVRRQVSAGVDPTTARRIERAKTAASYGETFAEATAKWLAHRRSGWSAGHARTTERALERDVLPSLGRLPISEITPAMIAHVIDRITARGANETAGKVRQNVERVFAYALVEQNPAIPVKEKLRAPMPSKPHPALLEFPALGDVLRRTELSSVTPAVRGALRLVAFTACRIGNAINATWEQFELDGATPIWVIPRAEMKAKKRQFPHRIILGPTITRELREWRQATGRRTGLVFTSPLSNRRGRPLTHEAIEKVYSKRLGLSGVHTVHGWRSAFSTLAREAGGFAHEAVELALDHEPRTEVARAYDRGERLEERVRLYYWWDAQLVAGQHGTDAAATGEGGGMILGPKVRELMGILLRGRDPKIPALLFANDSVGAHPTIPELADVLRSDEEIPPNLRRYIAGRLDGTIRATKAGTPKRVDPAELLDKAMDVALRQAQYVIDGNSKGHSRTLAIQDVAARRGVDVDTLRRSLLPGQMKAAGLTKIVPEIHALVELLTPPKRQTGRVSSHLRA